MDLQSLVGFTIKSVNEKNNQEVILTFTNGLKLELYAYIANHDDPMLECEVVTSDNHDDNYTVEYVSIK